MANIADSMLDEDRTLPVDVDGSITWNAGHLPDITIGPQLPHMACYTMKEYEQKFSDLKKENFNLKLRIYFLEEKQQYNFDGDTGQLIRTNVELKVSMQELKNDLQEKQELLKKASLALNTLSEQRESDLQEANDTHQRALRDAQEQSRRLQLQLATCQQELSQKAEQGQSTAVPKMGHSSVGDENERAQITSGEENDESSSQAECDAQPRTDITLLLKEKDEVISDLEKQMEDASKKHTKNALKRDEAIQGLAKVLRQKDKEISSLQDETSQLAEEFEGQRESLAHSEAEAQRLMRELEKAEQTLNQREDSLQTLRDALLQQKHHITADADSLEEHYQALLDDQQRRLDSQEKMLQRLTKSLQGKDRQLQDMIQAQGALGERDSRDSLVDSLKIQVVEKERAIDDAIKDQMKSSEEKEAEIRQLKVALRERDIDIERANQMLLTTEETIDGLERETSEKDTTRRRLASALKAQEKALEDAVESHERSLAEKEVLIEKLRHSLHEKGQNLQDSLRQSFGPNDVVIQQLQAQLEERDQLLQEMLSDRSRLTDKHDQAIKQLLMKVREKDKEHKVLAQRHQQEVGQLNKQLQTAQSDLNKKDFQLQSLESKAALAEDNQQERLDKLKANIREKDRTIESLVDSGRQKDHIIMQLQSAPPSDRTHETWLNANKLAELQKLKDELALQADTIQNKEAIIDRLRAALERHSPRSDMVPRIRLRDAEEELSECRQDDLEQQLLDAQGECQNSTDRTKVQGPCQKCAELQEKLEELEKDSGRSVIPKRTQTLGGNSASRDTDDPDGIHLVEVQQLTDALRAKHDIYVNITNAQASDSARVFEQELAAVQALRAQLEAGLQSNRDMRAALEVKGQATEPHRNSGDDDDVAALKQKVALLQTQLEESQRWNTSLQARLQQQQMGVVRDGGVGGALEATDDTPKSPGFSRSRTVTANKPGSIENWRYAGDISQHLGLDDSEMNSFMPSFIPVQYSLDEQIPDDETLSRMSQENLQGLLSNLRKQIQNASLDNHNHSGNFSDGPESLCKLRTELSAVRAEKDLLSSQVALLKSQAQYSSGQDSQIGGRNHETENSDRPQSSPGLESSAMERVASLTAELAHTQNLNSLLRKQIELNARSDEDAQSNSRDAAEGTSLSGKPANGHHLKASTVPKKSHIPQRSRNRQVSAGSSISGTDTEPDDLKSQLTEARSQNIVLQSTLASTEATVRNQAEKIKTYRRQLESAGITPRTPPRSRSESNLAQLAGPPEAVVTRTSSSGAISASASLKGVDMQRMSSFGKTQSISELQEQVSELQSCVKRYDTAVRNLRGRSRSAGSTSSSSHGDESRGSRNRTGVSHIPILANRVGSGGSQRSKSSESDDGSLQAEVDSLKRQLSDARTTNADLSRKVDEVSRSRGDSATRIAPRNKDQQCDVAVQTSQKIAQTPILDNATLRKQLMASQNLTEHLRKNLAELGEVVEGYLQQSPQDEAGVMDRTLDRITSLKAQLNNSRDVVADHSLLVQGPDQANFGDSYVVNGLSEPSHDLIVSSVSNEVRTLDPGFSGIYQEKYSEAKKEITALHAQLDAAEGYKVKYSEAMNEMETLRAQLDSGDSYKQKYSEAQREITSLRAQLDEFSSNQDTSLSVLACSKTPDLASRSRIDQTLVIMEQENETLLHKVDMLSSKVNDLQEKLVTETEHLSVSEKEKEVLMQKLSRVVQQNKKLKTQLEESQHKRLGADTELSQLRTETKKSADRLVEVELDRDRLRRDLHSNKDVNVELRSQLQKMSGDAQDRDQMLYVLRQRLHDRQDMGRSHLQTTRSHDTPSYLSHDRDTRATQSQPHIQHPTQDTDNRKHRNCTDACGEDGRAQFSFQSTESMMSIERARHETVESEPRHSVFLSPSTVNASDFDNDMLSLEDLTKDAIGSKQLLTNNTHDSEKHPDFNRYLTSASHDTQLTFDPRSSAKSQVSTASTDLFAHSLQPASPEDLVPSLAPLKEHPGPSTSSSTLDSASLGDSITSEVNLRTQIQMAEELNATMQEIYEQVNLHETSISAGIQKSPEAGHPGVQDPDHNDGEANMDLERHFEEMRLLRQKLEQSIGKNDNLQKMLKNQVSHRTERHVSIQVVESMKTELTSLTSQLQTRTRQMKNLNSEIERLRKSLQQKSEEVVSMNTKVKDTDDKIVVLELQMSNKDREITRANSKVFRLEEDIARFREQLTEKTDLNNTLRMELRTYTSMEAAANFSGSGSGPSSSDSNLDLGKFLREFSKLRVTLERTIDNNNLLREKLEERIMATGTSSSMEYVDIQHHTRKETRTLEVLTNGSPIRGEATDVDPQGNGYHDDSENTQRARFSPTFRAREDGMRYNITDPQRPPSPSPDSHPCHDNSEVPTEQDPTSVRVGSDLRSLYAIGALDDYELLKKQIAEALSVVMSLEGILRPASQSSTSSKSLMASTLRGAQSVVENLLHVLQELDRLVALFWTSELPKAGKQGIVGDALQQENLHLKQQVLHVYKKYKTAKGFLDTCIQQLNTQNDKKERVGRTVCDKLEGTHEVFVQAKRNLSNKVKK